MVAVLHLSIENYLLFFASFTLLCEPFKVGSVSDSFFFFFLEIHVLLFIYLFIYDCVESSSLCEGFLQPQQAGTTLHRGARASHHRGLSCCGAQAPDAQAQ